MRLIGHLDNEKDARTFGDFLYVQGIETEFEYDDRRWSIWVHEEERLAEATRWLEEFRAHPRDPRFLAGSPAEKLREQARADDAAYRKRVIKGDTILTGLSGYGFGVVTYSLIVVCVIVAFVSKMGKSPESIAPLFISELRGLKWSLAGLEEIRHGQVWRLFTPVFIHFGILHILFNMLWLKDLGSMFEGRLGSTYFGAFVFVTAAVSNLAQYLVTGSPGFGGMSGVVYGLIGYVWIRGRFDPAAGLMLDKQNLIMALVWFVICFLPGLMPIANYAHGGGLVLGMAWAFVDSKRK